MAIILSDSQGTGGTSGVGKGLNYVGDYVFANSGGFTTSSSSDVTLLSFTTGNFYTVADLTFVGSTTDNDPAAGLRSNFKLLMNGVAIANYHSVTGQGAAASSTDVVPILIPPYTSVVVSNRATATTGTVFAQLIGRVYR